MMIDPVTQLSDTFRVPTMLNTSDPRTARIQTKTLTIIVVTIIKKLTTNLNANIRVAHFGTLPTQLVTGHITRLLPLALIFLIALLSFWIITVSMWFLLDLLTRLKCILRHDEIAAHRIGVMSNPVLLAKLIILILPLDLVNRRALLTITFLLLPRSTLVIILLLPLKVPFLTILGTRNRLDLTLKKAAPTPVLLFDAFPPSTIPGVTLTIVVLLVLILPTVFPGTTDTPTPAPDLLARTTLLVLYPLTSA